MNPLPLLLNLTAALQRARPLQPASHRDAGEPDWRSAYQRLRGEEQPPGDPPVVPLPAPAAWPGATGAETKMAEMAETPEVRPPSAQVEAPRRLEFAPAVPAWQPLPAAHRGLGEPERRGIRQQPRADEPPPPETSRGPQPWAAAAKLERVEARPAPSTAADTLVTARIEALRQLEPASVARVWQVDLPGAGPGWQLQVAQAQPQAPLNLELRVPPAAQSQARQQLSDLDRRLRDAGHDVLRPRLRGARAPGRRWPIDEVGS